MIIMIMALLFCCTSHEMVGSAPIDMQRAHIQSKKIALVFFQIVQRDCNPGLPHNGLHHYADLKNHKDVASKKRALNGGVLPISQQAKESYAQEFIKKIPDNPDRAAQCFRLLAERHALHPLSIDKTVTMIHEEYDRVVQREQRLRERNLAMIQHAYLIKHGLTGSN